jgi:heterodisulfide reductase subunit C
MIVMSYIYYKYKKEHLETILESGQNMVKVTQFIRKKYSRPDDWTYQELMEKMQIAAEEMADIVKSNDKEGALEDAQWQDCSSFRSYRNHS